MWVRAVVAAAKRLIATEPIDIVHHVGWSTLSVPPLLWRTGKPFVWGPVGGGQVTPWRFLGPFGLAAVAELLRTLRVGILPWMPSLRRTVARADLTLAVNGETAAVLRRAGAAHVSILPDTGIRTVLLQPRKTDEVGRTTLTVLWAGRFTHWKGLDICLDVAKAVQTRGVRFLIAGGWGPLGSWVERRVKDLGLDERVTILGSLSWHEMQQRLADVDLFLFTSLRDTLGTVNFEAMAKGCPVICLNHTGVGTHLPDTAAIKVPVTTPREVVKEIAVQIDALASDPMRLRQLSDSAYRFATTQQWDLRAMNMEQLYCQVLADGSPKSAMSIEGPRLEPDLL
jgi:glycosyltransferase involved in cell wall biosynthesis